MNSIRVRLIVGFIVVATLLLGAFGIYARFELSHNLEQRFAQITHATTTRLAISASHSLWNFDAVGAVSLLQAEMLQSELNAIEVFDNEDKLFAAVLRDEQGHIVITRAAGRAPGIKTEADIFLGARESASSNASGSDGTRDARLGRLVVYFSRAHIDQALHEDAQRWIIEALVIDSLLALALSMSLRMVFSPLRRLRDALFELAQQGGDDAHELTESGRTEFIEVIQAFNQTQRKLQQVMARRLQAEAQAHAAMRKTKQAYADLQSAQQSMLQSDRLASLGALVAGVAHEVNTPVGITLTSASVLRDATTQLQQTLTSGAIRKSDMTAYVSLAVQSTRLIMANAERAAHLIQSFKRVAVDQTSEQRRKYELDLYLDEVMTSLHPMLKKAGVQVSIECAQPVLLDGYPGAMAQVLSNLTINALTHAFVSGAGGMIKIRAEQTGDQVSLHFCDNGCGIPREIIGKIFDPFFTTRRGQGGTGLGLNIVYNIMCKQFGGSITVRSEPNQETCFLLSFPARSPMLEQELPDGGTAFPIGVSE